MPSKQTKFFVVTTSALYEVDTEPGVPTVTKLPSRGDDWIPAGSCLRGGTHLGITEIGATMYSPVSREEAGLVNTRAWGNMTSGIVALFLEEEAAKHCLASGDLQIFDPRWRDKTLATLDAIDSMDSIVVDSTVLAMIRG